MAPETSGDCFDNRREFDMSYEKVSLTNEHECIIASYCAENNIEFNQANAYDVVMSVFQDKPITITDDYGEHDVTARIARLIECHPRTVDRIADKIELKKIEVNCDRIQQNIQRAKNDSKPDIEILLDNLYRLNIVDENSYLALVCFLMQLKYSRDNEILENDKTCVFFNGVARNGKSATAKAICDVEGQYGTVFKAQSGKLLESTHEEQVWKSHLNYFDEVKPADVDYINAHGTSTGLGDVGELLAVKKMFTGTNACMSSTKSMTGHLLGAAGAVEAIFCALAIRDGIVPATINLDNPIDEVGDFDLVPNKAKKRDVNVALSNSFGFGGTNASLVLKKLD